MQPPLKTAILEFLANEFKLNPDGLAEDINFRTDLNLSPNDISDLIERLQDALDFTFPEGENISQINTLGDLFTLLDIETDSDRS